MRVTSLEVRNYRGFAQAGPLAFGPTNVLIGPNNGGKSSLIRALYLMQSGMTAAVTDVRIGSGATMAEVLIALEGVDVNPVWGSAVSTGGPTLRIQIGPGFSSPTAGQAQLILQSAETNQAVVNQLPAAEPHHLIVPYLSKRKAVRYAQDVGRGAAMAIEPSFEHLAARLSRLGNPAFPAHQRYASSCEEILGFVVTAVPSHSGQEPGVYVTRDETISIEAMGEGVPNIVGLLVDLALSEGKLFLIEEIENDLHPLALKALLRLILESAENDSNQFVVSTHSNIVARYLASPPDSKLFYVDVEDHALPPNASVREVPPDPNVRMEILRELGYELNDFNLWDGWIFLEESSAERIVRDHLIPWFAPRLVQRVRTLSADGSSNVEPTFDDFHRLVRFTHLEPVYRGRAWVIIDGDEVGQGIIARLQERYGVGWDPSRFRTWRERDFEAYYPPRFADDRSAALAQSDRQARREAKRQLLEQVRTWIGRDPELARSEFEVSAAEVIDVLRTIESDLFGPEREAISEGLALDPSR